MKITKINLTSDYKQWELDDAILACFPEYQFTFDLERGRKEIRLQISRYQSDHSTDGWGRPIPNPLNETKYLVKKSDAKSEKFNPEIKVLFGDSEKNYFIDIVNGINKTSGEEGFLLVNEFKTKQGQNKPDIFKDKLYKSPLEAFQSGHYKVQELVNPRFQ